jgi:hypothetical protein
MPVASCQLPVFITTTKLFCSFEFANKLNKKIKVAVLMLEAGD